MSFLPGFSEIFPCSCWIRGLFQLFSRLGGTFFSIPVFDLSLAGRNFLIPFHPISCGFIGLYQPFSLFFDGDIALSLLPRFICLQNLPVVFPFLPQVLLDTTAKVHPSSICPQKQSPAISPVECAQLDKTLSVLLCFWHCQSSPAAN